MVEIEGKVEAVNEKNPGICMRGKWYDVVGRAAGFLPRMGDMATATVEEDGKITFIRAVRPPAEAPRDAGQYSAAPGPRAAYVPVEPPKPVIRKDFMRECLWASFSLWEEATGSAAIPGKMRSLAMRTNQDGAQELNAELVLQLMVNTAQSMFIDATKETRVPIRR